MALARAVHDSKTVLPMEMQDLRAIIERPAALPDVQLTFEDNLVGDLLFESLNQPGALPLLEFTLDQLFQMRDGHKLTLSAYKQIGGVKGALTKQAETTYTSLPSEEHRTLARTLFLRLIDPGASELDTRRRRAALSELSLSDAKQTTILQEVANAFIAARLLTTNEITGTTTIEVSHEALIREWPRLMGWLDEARDDVRLQQVLDEDIVTWQRRGQPKDRLYQGSQLKEAKAWARRNIPSRDELAFLQASTTRRMRSLVSVMLVLLLLLSTTGATGWFLTHQPPDPTHVTTLNDDGTGSLRWTIANAPTGSTITFDQGLWGHTIRLTNQLLINDKNLSIRGPGASSLTVNSPKGVHVVPGAAVSISSLTFKGSLNRNPLFDNEGRLILTNSTISDNSSDNLQQSLGGGGISNEQGATLTLINSTVSDNSGRFGGIDNAGTLTITNSTVSHNSAVVGGGGIYNVFGSGGGIYNSGTLTLTNSTISHNSAVVGGGGIYNFFVGGGGIYNIGDSTLINCTVSDNSTVSGNNASLVNDTPLYVGGGGIYNIDGTLTLTNSTVSANTVSVQNSYGGGISNEQGTLTLTNSTVSDNTAFGYGVHGGGIAMRGSQANITFSTIYGNTTTYGNITTGNGGGLSIEDSSVVDVNGTPLKVPSQVNIRNSIIAGNQAATDPDISGRVITDGYNLIQNNSGVTFNDPHNMHATDIIGGATANLGIDPHPHDNGGSTQPHTWTHKLLQGSPALDVIPLDACLISGKPSTDQRGIKRPQGKKCDIGAYELAA